MTIDELMIGWQGVSTYFCHDGVPYQKKIPRNPLSIGVEMKAIASCELDKQRKKPFSKEYGEVTAVCLRSMIIFFVEAHTLYADSAFSSVKTLLALAEDPLHGCRQIHNTNSEYCCKYPMPPRVGEPFPLHRQ